MPAPRSLAELERDVARDLELIAHPRAPWLEPKSCRGEPVLDVLLIGAGQSALAVAFALLRDKVTNILCIDRAEEGLEGPWLTYARMHTLRSWKDQTGPDLHVPSLTYQAWHEARWGAEDFAAMRYIPKEKWAAYLAWFRRVTGIPVRNRVEAGEIVPDRTDDGLPCLAVATSAGTIRARKVVLAAG
ncbi:MAG: FAD/NAD(P)-binding protein [Elioraea sp.]|nr:FAD/NAD(P)-binding protein [Elioraea sp.]